MLVQRLIVVLLILMVMLSGISCQKENSCETCGAKNKMPVAVAGKDQVILLPKDSAVLDGSASSDPDGIISAYQWTKISGPAGFNISNASLAVTVVKGLTAGAYQVELKVTDDKGANSKDTVLIVVSTLSPGNHPPVANAGPDQSINLPANSVTVNGSSSSDPDNNIVSYSWLKIAGPSAFNIVNANSVQTQITNLAEGNFSFQLTVTDAGGLFSKDTVHIIVGQLSSCNANRTIVSAQLTMVSSIPGGGYYATIGNHIYFLVNHCGTCQDTARSLSYLYIFDVNTKAWSFSKNYQMRPRANGALITSGNKIFYAGGKNTDGSTYSAVLNDVDIYDAATDTWTYQTLSIARSNLVAAAVNNKIVFAGGLKHDPAVPPGSSSYIKSDVVDIYDVASGTWATAALSQARTDISAVTVNGKVYLAGGMIPNGSNLGLSNVIDIYNEQLNTWSSILMTEPKANMMPITLYNKIFWAGGVSGFSGANNYVGTSNVEVRDLSNNSSALTCLFKPNYGYSAVTKGGKIVFFTGSIPGDIKTKFDIYDVTGNSWSVGVLPSDATGTLISINNTLYLVGNYGSYERRIWKLDF